MRPVSAKPRVIKMSGTNERPSAVHPIAILVTLGGSFLRLACQPHSMFRSGVSMKMHIGFTA